jgi:hypothetical protein
LVHAPVIAPPVAAILAPVLAIIPHVATAIGSVILAIIPAIGLELVRRHHTAANVATIVAAFGTEALPVALRFATESGAVVTPFLTELLPGCDKLRTGLGLDRLGLHRTSLTLGAILGACFTAAVFATTAFTTLGTTATIAAVTPVASLGHGRGRCRRGKQRHDYQFPHDTILQRRRLLAAINTFFTLYR